VVEPVFDPVTPTAVVSRAATVFPPIAAILSQVSAILSQVVDVFAHIANVLLSIPHVLASVAGICSAVPYVMAMILDMMPDRGGAACMPGRLRAVLGQGRGRHHDHRRNQSRHSHVSHRFSLSFGEGVVSRPLRR